MNLYAAPYFNRPYQDSDHLSMAVRCINNNKYLIYRPNHGLAHSARQGFLALEVANILLRNPKLRLHNWICNRIKNDEKFLTKLYILSSFQRSGRQSEISSSGDPLLYASYQESDVRNFQESVDLEYFCCKNEIAKWSQALRWGDGGCLGDIIQSAHLLDLRRITKFDPIRIKNNISDILHIDVNSKEMNILWQRSGQYLAISGDRDLVSKKDFWSNRFYTLQQNPEKLYYRLLSNYREHYTNF
jgi:hypothetical protein